MSRTAALRNLGANSLALAAIDDLFARVDLEPPADIEARVRHAQIILDQALDMACKTAPHLDFTVASDGWPGLVFYSALWQFTLPSPEQVVARAKAVADGEDVDYRLGQGTTVFFDTLLDHGLGADCSAFIAYILLRAKSGGVDWKVTYKGRLVPSWLHTDSVHDDAVKPGRQKLFIPMPADWSGPFISVYPDYWGTRKGVRVKREGHIALITQWDGAQWAGYDCSSSQSRKHGDATRFRDLTFMKRKSATVQVIPRWWVETPHEGVDWTAIQL